MTFLQSLPTLSRPSADATLAASTYALLGITAGLRGRAADALAHHLRERTLQPRQVSRAIAQGDIAVSELLRSVAPLPVIPTFQQNTLADLPGSGTLSPDMVDELIALATQLIADGDMEESAFMTLATGSRRYIDLLKLIQDAWHARSARIAERLLPQTYKDPYVCYFIVPMAVHKAIVMLSGDTYNSLGELLDESIHGGVLCELIDSPIVRLPASPIDDPGFFAALTGVWSAIASASRFFFLAGFDRTLDDLFGYASEFMNDAIISATWSADGEPTFTRDALDLLQMEIGSFEDTDVSLAAYAKWSRAAKATRSWKPGSAQLERWLSSGATAKQAGLIQRLTRHLSAMKQAQKKMGKPDFETDWAGDGCFPVSLLATQTGMDGFFSHHLDGMYESGEPPVVQIAAMQSPANVAQILRIADHVIVEATIATACLNEIAEYEV